MDAVPEPNGGGREQCQIGRQQHGEGKSVEIGQAGNVVQGGVYPIKLNGVGNQAKQVGTAGSNVGTELQQADEGRKQQRHQPEMVVGGESERRGGGQQGNQQPIYGRAAPESFEFGKDTGHDVFNGIVWETVPHCTENCPEWRSTG